MKYAARMKFADANQGKFYFISEGYFMSAGHFILRQQYFIQTTASPECDFLYILSFLSAPKTYCKRGRGLL